MRRIGRRVSPLQQEDQGAVLFGRVAAIRALSLDLLAELDYGGRVLGTCQCTSGGGGWIQEAAGAAVGPE